MTGLNGEAEDLELIESIHSGRTDLFQRLVEKYQKRIYNFGLKICPNPQDAEDLVQESFINVFRYLKDFRRESSFKNWLYLIASSVCHKMKRKSKFAPERELSLEEFIPDDHDSVKKEIPDWAVEPSERLLNRELSDKIQSAIAGLPTDHRLVLVLRDMEGFSTEEAAGILHISTANVKVRLHRARLFVRDVLKEYYEHEPRKKHDHSMCIDCFSRLSEYIDNELGDAVCSDVKKHLEQCTCCSTCLATLRKTIELCGCVEDKPVPENLSAQLKSFAQEISQ